MYELGISWPADQILNINSDVIWAVSEHLENRACWDFIVVRVGLLLTLELIGLKRNNRFKLGFFNGEIWTELNWSSMPRNWQERVRQGPMAHDEHWSFDRGGDSCLQVWLPRTVRAGRLTKLANWTITSPVFPWGERGFILAETILCFVYKMN